MNSSAVVIISRKRADVMLRGFTAKHMRCASCPVYLAVREDEAPAYAPVCGKYPYLRPLFLPAHCTDSGLYRDAALRHKDLNGVEKVLICDDDLVFSYRDWSGTALPKLPDERIDEALDAVFSEITETTPHVGLRFRQFAHTCTKRVDEYKRIMWTHGVHRSTCIDNGLTFAWAHPVLVDFHFQLSVIRAGFRTAVVNSYIADDGVGPYRNSGGCNLYRTRAVRTTAAYALQGQFPEAVQLRKKQAPTGEYTDVTVYFSKARPAESAEPTGVRK